MEDAASQKVSRPLGGPWSFFRRLRVLCGGQVIEDLENYNRCHQLFSSLFANNSRLNEAAEGFGREWDHINHMKNLYTPDSYDGIEPGQAQTVIFQTVIRVNFSD